MNKENATNIGKIKTNAIEWYVPHYTPCISNQAILSKQNLSKTLIEIPYVQSFVFMKDVITQNLWNFELDTQEGVIVSVWIIVGFQQRVRQNSQNLNNDTFCRPPVTSVQCIIGTENILIQLIC